jgi:prepilin-type N-terminal cleavage/methylation domain-containing protein
MMDKLLPFHAFQARVCGRRGFTLVELIATIAILASVSVVASGIVMEATDHYVVAKATSELHTEMSIAMDRALREIRAIGLDTSASGIAPDIDSTTLASLDWDDDSSLTKVGSDVVLVLDNNPGYVLMTDVTTMNIRKYNESNVQVGPTLVAAACDPIRRVEITLTAQRQGVSHTLRGRVFLRCTSQPTGD